jgi:hypothetical protein
VTSTRSAAAAALVTRPSVPEQKLGEMRAKLASLAEELDNWTEVSRHGQPMEKLNTRIRAIRVILKQAIEPLAARIGEDPGPRVLDLAAGLELSILEIHRVWEFFRAKLALRYVPWLSGYLLAADELAWRCYEPMLPYIEGVGREPPLVFLNGALSPFTMPRGTPYRAEEVPGEAITSQQLERLLESLPIPVIGVPWFQLRHLPDALVIAHEVGHDVEHDVGLGEELDAAIRDAVDTPRVEAWRSWRSEVFADIFGALSAGPAFAGALVDFVARAPRFIATERRSPAAWGRYPTAAIRVMLVLRVLAEVGFDDQVGGLRARWLETYPQHAGADFADDVPHVVDALLGTPYQALGHRTLTDLDRFSAAMYDRAVASADDALAARKPRADDALTLIAAARLAYERGDERYATRDVPSRILRKVEAAQKVGVRGSGETAPPESERDARDRARGQELAQRIAAAHQLTSQFEPLEGGADV